MQTLTEFVLDASALLALINQEPGGEKVRAYLPRSVISAVNYCEILQCLRRGGMPAEIIPHVLAPLVSKPPAFDEGQACLAATIQEKTRHLGLSFGDCACLALAQSRSVPAVTAERNWRQADIGIEVLNIR